LRRRQDFVAVTQRGRRVRHSLLMLGILPNGLEESRMGYAIGKRVGNAVTRNRVRRRLREIVRAAQLAPGYDIVLTARPEAAAASFKELRGAFVSCADRGRLIMAENR
jgi:ribonuclease P protein component